MRITFVSPTILSTAFNFIVQLSQFQRVKILWTFQSSTSSSSLCYCAISTLPSIVTMYQELGSGDRGQVKRKEMKAVEKLKYCCYICPYFFGVHSICYKGTSFNIW